MRLLTITERDLVQSPDNNTYVYNFPAGSVQFKSSDYIALKKASIYYSWFSISQELNNNSFRLYYPVGAAIVSGIITIPNGTYSVDQLNAFLQSQLIALGFYLVDTTTGDYIYYVEFKENEVRYGIQLNLYNVPSVLPPTYVNPAGTILPLVSQTPQLEILSTNDFGLLIGYSFGTYPTVPSPTSVSFLGQNVPQLSPVQSIVVRCSLIHNTLQNPSDVLFAFSPNKGFGEILDVDISKLVFSDISPGIYNQVQLEFVDQNFRNIKIKDTNLTILLALWIGDEDGNIGDYYTKVTRRL